MGVDIGCGMEVTVLKDRDIDLEDLDKVIRDFVPSGFDSSKLRRNIIPKRNYLIATKDCDKRPKFGENKLADQKGGYPAGDSLLSLKKFTY